MFYDHCEEEGFLITEDVATRTVEWFAGPTLDEYLTSWTTEGDYNEEAGRNLLLVEEDVLDGYNFFLSEGKYTVEQRSAWLSDVKVDNTIALAVAEMVG